MEKLIWLSLKKKSLVYFVVSMMVVYGLYSYYLLPKQDSPEVAAPWAILLTIYPGASPVDVEQLVTKKIEDAASTITGFRSVRSFSRDSASIVGVQLSQDADIDKAWAELRNKINDISGELPQGTWKTQFWTNLAETAGMLISLSGDKYSYDQLVSFAEAFKKRLAGIDGITRFDIQGEIKKEVSVEVEIEKLNQIGLSLEELLIVLQAQNIEIPSGRIEKGSFGINVSTPGVFGSVQDIENMIFSISKENGSPVRLKDVARVQMVDKAGVYKIKQDGKNAVLLAGYFQPSKNVILVGEEVRKVLDKEKKKFPKDLYITEVTFQPEDVAKAVHHFVRNLIEGIVLVIVVIFFGMGVRNALVVSTAIPLCIVFTFGLMSLLGVKVHQVSIAALIIAVGMLVDDAIVVSDAIQVRLDAGDNRLRAAFEGARRSAIPVLTSTLTNMASYLPLQFLPGMAGDFLGDLPMVVNVSLIVSYVLAMLLSPALAMTFFRKAKHAEEEREGALKRAFAGFLDFGLRNTKKTLIAAAAMLGLSLWLITLLGLSFFPNAETNMMWLDVTGEFPDFKKTEALATEVEGVLKKQLELTSYTTAIGNGLPKFYIANPITYPSKDYAQILFKVDLKKGGRFDTNEAFANYLQKELDATVSGGKATVKLLQLGEPVDAPVLIRVSGDDMTQNEKISKELQKALRNIPGTMNVRDNQSSRLFEMVIDVDNDLASSMLVAKWDIQRQVNVALYGAKSCVFRKAGKEYDIVVRSNITTKEELENLGIKSTLMGSKVMIKQFANITLRPQLSNINRFNKERSIAVMADVVAGNSSASIETEIEKNILPKMGLGSANVTFDGERERIKENFGNVGMLGIWSIFLIYLIMFMEFGSFRQPFVILATVPLSVIGCVIGLLVTGLPMSFTAALGIASLGGLVVKNAILLVDYINEAREHGADIETACRDSVSRRFRPVMLVSIAMMIGLVPLALSGSPMFAPMAIVLLSGLFTSTTLTLVMVPLIYKVIIRA